MNIGRRSTYGVRRSPILQDAKQGDLTRKRTVLGHIVQLSDGTTRIEWAAGTRPPRYAGR